MTTQPHQKKDNQDKYGQRTPAYWAKCISNTAPPTKTEIKALRTSANNTMDRVDMQHIYLIIYVFAVWLAGAAKFFHTAYTAHGLQYASHPLQITAATALTFGIATITAYFLCTSIENRSLIIPSAISIGLTCFITALILTKAFHIRPVNYWQVTSTGAVFATFTVTIAYGYLIRTTEQARKTLSETTEVINNTSAKIQQWSTKDEIIRTYQQMLNDKDRPAVQGEYDAMQKHIKNLTNDKRNSHNH